MIKPILITTGEPAGIGMDIVLMLASQNKLAEFSHPIIALANLNALNQRMAQLVANGGLSAPVTIQAVPLVELLTVRTQHDSQNANNTLKIVDMTTPEPVIAGELNENNASMVLTQLDFAHTLANNHTVSAIVTAPLHKSVIMASQPDFMGHTEYFMAKSHLNKVVMMLANSQMKVALVTTHIPLRAVADAITAEEVKNTVDIVLQDLTEKFGLKTPKILVCGLNPHAGEGGYLGREEIDVINPVLQSYRDKGVDISLALPADTLFTPKYLKDCDCVIAMYHDQGLAPLKSHGFGETVNITLGLPYIRTSVDHGTALDLAGTGQANPTSLYHAIAMAEKMALAKESTI